MEYKSIIEYINNHGQTLLLDQLQEIIDSDEQVLEIINSVIFGICNECWGNPSPCSCWNDE